nr:MAG TPA: hypothetical protein [Caudoviricetes sp.]
MHNLLYLSSKSTQRRAKMLLLRFLVSILLKVVKWLQELTDQSGLY